MKLAPALTSWLPLAAGLTIAFGTLFVVGQQGYRQAANDPQIQLARDAQLTTIDGLTVDIATSLSTFQMNIDDNYRVLATTGQLDGTTVTPPAGVFTFTKHHGENRFTWQPRPGVRLATVIVKKDGGYVLVARNLSETQSRTNELLGLVGLGWTLSLAVTLAISWWPHRATLRRPARKS